MVMQSSSCPYLIKRVYAKAFLSTPGRTRGFVKPKGNKKVPFCRMAKGNFLFHINFLSTISAQRIPSAAADIIPPA